MMRTVLHLRDQFYDLSQCFQYLVMTDLTAPSGDEFRVFGNRVEAAAVADADDLAVQEAVTQSFRHVEFNT